MANRERGEVVFECGGKEYTVRLSINALCEAEEALGVGFVQIYENLNNPQAMKLGYVRAMLWAGLRGAHPNMTMKEAGDLLNALGMKEAGRIVGEAITSGLGLNDEADAEDPKPKAAL